MSIEVISPPRRPITRSVSAKRAADEMELEDTNTLFISSSPRPRKVRKVTGASGMFASRRWQRLLTLQQNFQARSRCLRAPKAPSRSRRTVPPALFISKTNRPLCGPVGAVVIDRHRDIPPPPQDGHSTTAARLNGVAGSLWHLWCCMPYVEGWVIFLAGGGGLGFW